MTLIKTVDVSSHQPASIANLGQWIAAGCQILWVHSYHSGEQPGLDQTTRDWISVARQAGIWCLPYCWLFRNYDVVRSVRDSIQLFRDADMPPKVVALDCESYGTPVTDPGPTAEQILAAATEARSMDVEVVLYSGKWWLDGMVGDHEILRGVPAWIANYDGHQTLDVGAPDWTKVIGHQYTSTPIDWSVFDLEALLALAAPADPCLKLRSDLQAIVSTRPYKAPAKKVLTALLK